MKLLKLARIVGLCSIVSITALTTFAAPTSAVCSCNYCTQHIQRDCTLDGQPSTCSYFLAVTTCAPAS
jgi:hypothetical protein